MPNDDGAATILAKLTSPEFAFVEPLEKLLFIQCAAALWREKRSAFRLPNRPMTLDEIEIMILEKKPRNLEQKPNDEPGLEPSMETQIKNLVSVGLLARDADGAISCPLLAPSQSRAEASRNNGLKGGRPKKAKAENFENPRHPVLSAVPKKPEDHENDNPSERRTTYLLTKSSKEVKVGSSGDAESEFHDIGRQALAEAGLDHANSRASYGIVRQWLADGADRELILDVIQRKIRPGVTTLNYFTGAIRDAIAAKPAVKPKWEKEYWYAVSTWDLMGRQGPHPKEADFKPPAVA